MKKLFMIAFSLFLTMSLVACLDIVSMSTSIDTSSTTSTSTLTTTTDLQPTTSLSVTEVQPNSDVVKTYAENVDIDIYHHFSNEDLPEVYIDIEFTLITYSPVLDQVCVQFDVHDDNPLHASYFMLLHDVNSFSFKTQSQFYGGGKKDFSSGGCFNIIDRSLKYRLHIGKFDLDNEDFVFGQIEVSAYIDISDQNILTRKAVEVLSSSDKTPDYSQSMTESIASFEFVLKDTSDAISHMTVVIKETLGNTVDSLEYDAASLRQNDLITVTGSFDKLAPNVEYTIYVYVDGNDGYDDFEHEYVLKKTLISAYFEGQSTVHSSKAYHDLYAVIYDIEYSDTEATLHYYYVNNDTIKYTDTSEFLNLHLEYRDEKNQLIEIYELVEGDNAITIPIDLIFENNRFAIYDQKKANLFDLRYIESKKPNFILYKISNNEFEIQFEGPYENIVDFDIEVYVEGYVPCIESYQDFDIMNTKSIYLYHDFTNIDNDLIFLITITYEAYGKLVTYTDHIEK
ncbi:MAG: hypothetical protein CVV56_08465 [Tenericutes bacterium HGW-Tenericutes-1]|nr:MAG: hypothetical protein CVV58_00040 [Tenericutes bacterium HGW-Tenericutes-3]PKK99975.1 MAG: hypothetical protein CVV56_08465 [Tenericutes bacterium HGW-Tenericutes-1]